MLLTDQCWQDNVHQNSTFCFSPPNTNRMPSICPQRQRERFSHLCTRWASHLCSAYHWKNADARILPKLVSWQGIVKMRVSCSTLRTCSWWPCREVANDPANEELGDLVLWVNSALSMSTFRSTGCTQSQASTVACLNISHPCRGAFHWGDDMT